MTGFEACDGFVLQVGCEIFQDQARTLLSECVIYHPIPSTNEFDAFLGRVVGPVQTVRTIWIQVVNEVDPVLNHFLLKLSQRLPLLRTNFPLARPYSKKKMKLGRVVRS